MNTALILGGNGRIGSLAAKHLRERFPDARVIQLARKTPQDAPEGHFLRFDPFHDDWDSLPPCGLVVNAVGAIQPARGMSLEQVHVGLTERVLARRVALGNPRIVQISALGADPAHSTAFLGSKGRADALLLAQPDTCVIRPSIVCTPGTVLSQRMRQLLSIARVGLGKLLVPRGFPATKVQPILPEDLGALIAAAAAGDCPQVVEAVGPEALSFGELLGLMAEAQGRRLKLVQVPREIVEGFVQHFVAVWFPGILSQDQFQLLFQDNTGTASPLSDMLGRPLGDSRPFWRREALEGAQA